MTKISNQYSLTNILTADLTNSRLGINNVSPTVALDVTGAGKFSGVLTLGSTISNGTFTYTLPSATGTLALTSALSGYLPLTGGTLTGALGGTSATFSGLVTGAAYFNAQSNSGFRLRNLTDTATLGAFTRRGLWEGNANYDPAIWAETGYGLYLYTNGLTTPALTIASTGAATFSSSVSATSGTFSGAVEITTNTGSSGIELKKTTGTTGAWSINVNSSGNLAFDIYGTSTPFILNKTTSAATFSSSVTAGAEFKQPEGGGGGIYIKNGSFVQSGGTTVAFYAFTNLAKQSLFQVIIGQRGAASNTAIAYINMYSTSAAAYTIYQDNTNPALFLTLNMSGLDLRLTTGSGYGTTTWEYTITQIK